MSAVLDIAEVNRVGRLDRIMEFLSAEGFRPEKVSEFSIRLKVEGRTMWVDLTPHDDEFYQVIAANIWELEAEWEVQNAYQACSYVGNMMKLVKAYVTTEGKNIWVEASMFHKSDEEFLQQLVRAIDIVRLGVSRFVEKMRELKTADNQLKLH